MLRGRRTGRVGRDLRGRMQEAGGGRGRGLPCGRQREEAGQASWADLRPGSEESTESVGRVWSCVTTAG